MISMMRLLKPYAGHIFLVLLLTLIGIMLELYIPTLMADAVDIGIVNEDIAFIWQTGGWMIVCSILAIGLTIIVSFFASKTAFGFSRDLRRKLFVHVENLSMEDFAKIGPASLITRTTNDIKQIQDVLNMMLRMMSRAPLMLIGGVILAISRDAQLSFIFIATLPILAGLIFFISRKAIPLFGALQQKTDRLNLVLREVLTGIRVVRAFNRVKDEEKRFDQANEEYRDTGIRVQRIIAFMFPVMMIVMNVTSVAIVWFGAIRIDQGTMQVGNLMAFLQYAMMILMSLVMLSIAFNMIPRAHASVKRVNEVLQLQPSTEHGEDNETEADPQSVQKTRTSGHIQFNHVTFRYHGAEKPAVENMTFTARAGETTAIIGSTGAGKTSLVQLIPRFHDVERGAILLDGVDVRRMPQERLRQKIGYVPQKAILFSGTIAENLRIGNEDATEEELMDALRTAQALDFVQEREHGIHSHIEQAGANLSGGQKQRLSIARALVRKPEIYIFDDSFSALDYRTDAKLRAALTSYTKDATVILVTQRVSTAVNADRIVVLNEGQIAGIGTHEQLMQDNRVYQEIVASQQAEGESA